MPADAAVRMACGRRKPPTAATASAACSGVEPRLHGSMAPTQRGQCPSRNGHPRTSLLFLLRERADVVVASIYVNPTQVGSNVPPGGEGAAPLAPRPLASPRWTQSLRPGPTDAKGGRPAAPWLASAHGTNTNTTRPQDHRRAAPQLALPPRPPSLPTCSSAPTRTLTCIPATPTPTAESSRRRAAASCSSRTASTTKVGRGGGRL